MNKFAILTLSLLAVAALIYSQSTLALPGDDDSATTSTTQAPGAETEGNAATADVADVEEIAPRPADAEALSIFQDAQRRLFEHSSVRAQFREIISFSNRPFVAEGLYLAGGPLQMRLEYEIELGDMRGVLLQVCDGQVSWTRQQVFPITPAGEAPADEDLYSHTSRRDIDQILREAENHPGVEGATLVAELGIGGLPAMMAGIERMMTFDLHVTGEWNDRRFVVVEGRWREDLPQEVQVFIAAGPERVKVFLAEDTLFPERIVYLKKLTGEGNEYHQLLELQFRDVEFDVPVNPEAFSFISPPGTEEHDETRIFINLLDRLPAPNDEDSTATPVE